MVATVACGRHFVTLCAAYAPLEDGRSGDDVPLIIILTVCVIGMLLVAVNILLIPFFVRRRNKKLEKGLGFKETGSSKFVNLGDKLGFLIFGDSSC